MNRLLIIVFFGLMAAACSNSEFEKKGFQVSEIVEDEEGRQVLGLDLDSSLMDTRPREVLLTSMQAHRLTPIYKVNYNKKTKEPFTGSNSFHYTWYDHAEGNNWNSHIMPGFEAMYGYNLMNVAHYNHETEKGRNFFDNPVLIKTLYYPSFETDTLDFQPVQRKHYLVSVYDEDSNKDGFINTKDLRRFYSFDINVENKRAIVPPNYSVISSQYDPANDYMYVYAVKDANRNGQIENFEPTEIFWVFLQDPLFKGKQYPIAY